MGTTNILDLNNRLSKVEKGNVAQNSYTSLKNKPKINSVTLSGNKSLADIGAAAAADLGALTDLTTTDKSSCVRAINELNSRVGSNVFSDEVDIKSITYTCPSDGYIWLKKSEGTTGRFLIKVNNKYLLTDFLDKMGQYENRSLFVKKGFIIEDLSTADVNVYEFSFIPLVNS